ncbi:MAG: type IX secretion system protein PorQ [Bacteroidaceae bacterium]|nr:type IX secretion system protein PorQ [Bacteroidaceae bacterium]
MRKQLFLLTLILIPLLSKGQEATSVFNFLKIPMSAHVAALGGDNVSLKQDDPTLVFCNPAQAAAVNDNSLNLDYQTYVADTKILGAAFVKVFSVRHTVAVTGQVFNYGSMDETDEDGNVLGSFSAKDMAFSALYSYTLGNHWVGGATGRFITSKYADYSSTAVSVDLGLHYDNEEKGFSFGMALKNIGAQLSSFHEDHKEHLPFDMQVGFSHKMAHAPFRFSLTLKDLTRWSNNYYFNPKGKSSFGRKLTNHIVLGVDFLPIDKIYVAAGYNFRRANELKAAGSSHGAGLSFGAGLQTNKIKAGIAYAKYHVDASSLLFNVSYSF